MKNYLTIIITAVVVVAGTTWYFIDHSAGPATPEQSASVSPSVSSTVSLTPTPSSSPAVTKTPKPTGSLSPTPTPTPTPTPSATPTPTPTPTASLSPTPTLIVQEAKAYVVVIQNLAFVPVSLTVQQGDIVTFQNSDNFAHVVKASNLSFVSPNIQPNDEWTLETANLNPGTYDYSSTTHPIATGTLIIE